MEPNDASVSRQQCRVPAQRLRPIPALLAGWSLCFGAACSGLAEHAPHRGFDPVWRQYLELPHERALAIAGDRENLWVAGLSGGEPSRAAAEAAALDECGRRRLDRRILSPCRLYAVGDAVVWTTW